MVFQALDNKGRNFLELFDNNLNTVKPNYPKEESQLKYLGHSNSLCTRAMRAIVNHASIDEYWLRFFKQEDFACSYSVYPIETRRHILYKCRRYNGYWNPRKNTLAHFILFLEFNSSTFSFGKSITQYS